MYIPKRVRRTRERVAFEGWTLLLVACLGLVASSTGLCAQTEIRLPAIAIIIDDLGYRRPEGMNALALPGAVTYAILPHTPFAKCFADNAFSQGKEVLLHQPMESTHGLALGPGAITSDMTRAQVREVLETNLSSLPHLSGISNHMGSLLSSNETQINWMMETIASLPPRLFFVDSRTTSGSVIVNVARRNGVPAITRDVFLDNSLDPKDIRDQFYKLIDRAKSGGTALAIGHPHSTTITVLKSEFVSLSHLGVRLVKVSELLRLREVNRGLTAMQPKSNKDQATQIPKT